MADRFYKGLKIIGSHLCIYNTNSTANCRVYVYQDNIYFKPRYAAVKGLNIAGVKNLVLCKPVNIGVISAYTEI